MKDIKRTSFNSSGRPSQYDPGFHPGIGYRLCCLGLTNINLAFIFEVTEQTVINWLNQHKEFSQSVKQGKAVADSKVIRSLYQRAVGNDQCLPDVKASELWLRNRTSFLTAIAKSND